MNIKQKLMGTYLALMVGTTISASADSVREYKWLTGKEVSGALTVIEQENGRVTTKFHFNDRGRGPNQTTVFTVDKADIVTGFTADGVNYYKGEISETFNIQNNTASWQVDGKEKSLSLTKPTLYLPLNATPEYRAATVRALLKQPNHRMAMAAGGEAWLTILGTTELSHGDETVRVTLHEIEGPEVGPQYVWLDENKDLFSISYGWFSIIRDGWAHAAQQLSDGQFAATEDFVVRKSTEFSTKVTTDLIVTNAKILNTETGELSTPTTVRISGGKIAEVSSEDVPADAHVIDGTGKTLMPSLWDMHAHIQPGNYFNYIAGGFLNIRDMANDPAFIAKAQKGIAAGKIAAPDIYPVGFIDRTGPYAAPTGNLADSLDEALSLIDMYHGMGYKGIKLYSSIEPEWIPAMAERAHSYGMKVMGHIPSYMTAGEAVLAGYDEITHVNMALLHLIGDKSIDTRTPQRFIVPGMRSGSLDLSGQRTKEFIKLLQDKNITLDPTLGIFHDMFLNEPGKPELMARAYFEQLPPALRQSITAAKGYNDGNEEIFRKSAATADALVKKLHDAGITILPGTDAAFPGFALISELEMYVGAGVSTKDVLKLATIGSAKHIGLGDELGTVEVGKKAHLILVDGDPTDNISNLRNLSLVIKGQTYFKPKEMLKAQGYKPFSETTPMR